MGNKWDEKMLSFQDSEVLNVVTLKMEKEIF